MGWNQALNGREDNRCQDYQGGILSGAVTPDELAQNLSVFMVSIVTSARTIDVLRHNRSIRERFNSKSGEFSQQSSAGIDNSSVSTRYDKSVEHLQV